ncbi:UNVERIFIED_CONTAM: hypothetical protein GTU68_040142, partial [Idotea baltica]|nr:hypothetical protein [Idotea baltica]
RNIFISGIGTGIGKTLISAILSESLNADYWKPIQAGDLDNSDSIKVKNLLSNNNSKIYEERYKLNTPASPHYAAELDNIEIKLNDFILPESKNDYLIIEGAGGLLVPINNKDTIIDIIGHLNSECILISENYLGSINHTLLSYEALKLRDVNVLGIIFNGESNPATEEIILKKTKLDLIGNISKLDHINKETIKKEANNITANLKRILSGN